MYFQLFQIIAWAQVITWVWFNLTTLKSLLDPMSWLKKVENTAVNHLDLPCTPKQARIKGVRILTLTLTPRLFNAFKSHFSDWLVRFGHPKTLKFSFFYGCFFRVDVSSVIFPAFTRGKLQPTSHSNERDTSKLGTYRWSVTPDNLFRSF